jgi:hypothetical protein
MSFIENIAWQLLGPVPLLRTSGASQCRYHNTGAAEGLSKQSGDNGNIKAKVCAPSYLNLMGQPGK